MCTQDVHCVQFVHFLIQKREHVLFVHFVHCLNQNSTVYNVYMLPAYSVQIAMLYGNSINLSPNVGSLARRARDVETAPEEGF